MQVSRDGCDFYCFGRSSASCAQSISPSTPSAKATFADLRYIAIFLLLFPILAPTHGAGRRWEGTAELLPDPFPSRLSPSLPIYTLCASLLFHFAGTPCTLLAARSARVYIDTGRVNL